MSSEPGPEDFLNDSLISIFEDVPVHHGEPGGMLIHKTQNYGDIKLRLVKTDTDEELYKFAHHLWVAGIEVAQQLDTGPIDVKDLHVLELGAASGLCGILAVKAGASHVVLSDFPDGLIIDNVRFNVQQNLTKGEQSCASIVGHAWGESVDALLANNGRFDVILLADCLWLPEQHENLAKTLTETLKHSPDAVVHCIAGFHTGRRKLAGFFDCVAKAGLRVRSVYEQSYKGERRPWDPVRPDCEELVQKKQYIVCAQLGF